MNERKDSFSIVAVFTDEIVLVVSEEAKEKHRGNEEEKDSNFLVRRHYLLRVFLSLLSKQTGYTRAQRVVYVVKWYFTTLHYFYRGCDDNSERAAPESAALLEHFLWGEFAPFTLHQKDQNLRYTTTYYAQSKHAQN